MGHQQYISIQSQKGGVGKSSVALHLAKQLLATCEVLFLDLDLTGTSAALAVENLQKEGFWKDSLHIVSYENPSQNEYVNLTTLFTKYMAGNSASQDISRQLNPGQINVLSSHITRDEDKSTYYTPSVLFDSLHAEWFLEMIKEIVTGFSTSMSNRPVAIIIDNAPGYNGLEPLIEEWLTDIGPECSHFIFVASPDVQDKDAVQKAIMRIENLLQNKFITAQTYHGLNPSQNFTERHYEFFRRLAESAPDDDTACVYPIPNCRPEKCTHCGLCYYMDKKNIKLNSFDKNCTFIIENKVPREIFDKYTQSSDAINNNITIPFIEDLVLQFFKHSNIPTHTDINNNTSQIINHIKSIEKDKQSIDKFEYLFNSNSTPSPKNMENLFKLFSIIDEFSNIASNFGGESWFSDNKDILGLCRFRLLSSLIPRLKEGITVPSKDFSRQNYRKILENIKHSADNIHIDIPSLCTISLSIEWLKTDIEINIVVNALKFALITDMNCNTHINSQIDIAQINKIYKNFKSNPFISTNDAFIFYQEFVRLRTSFTQIPMDMRLICEALQTLLGTPKSKAIYGPAILSILSEVIQTRTITHEQARQYLAEFGMPVVNGDEVTLAPSSFDRFKQGIAFHQFAKALAPVAARILEPRTECQV